MTVHDRDKGQDLDDLLAMLKETRGFDFTGYKKPTLTRRIRRRMDALKVSSVSEYRDRLELEPDEFIRLFDSLLINVTGFFRDQPAWQALRDRVLPQLLAAKPGRRPLRAWSAGCATGEEAYTLAIVLAEVLGTGEFLERVKIYATDLDEDALAYARAGVYTERQVTDVSEELRQKYFEPAGVRYAFRRDLRRQIVFGRNDLTKDAPISRVDLLVARNTLMYFTAETQSNIIRKFRFALSDPGFLFLGKAEMLLNHTDEFEAVDLRKRLFRKLPQQAPAQPATLAVPPSAASEAAHTGLESAALDAGPVAQLVIDRTGRLATANLRAESLFSLQARDEGRPFLDLDVSYRPVELGSVIDRVTQQQQPVELPGVSWQRTPGGEQSVFDVIVVPLYRNAGAPIGVEISFLDVTRHRQLQAELTQSNHDLEHAYEELQSLNEELETTNEELQSTNEELETTNEELQSTNEELETMNEELQSTNDELQVINDAMRTRTGELESAQAFLSSVLRSLGNAVVVMDTDLRVTLWGAEAEDLWGLRADEALGRPVSDLDIGLPVVKVVPLLRQALAGEPTEVGMVVTGVNRRGRPVHMRVVCRLLCDEGSTPQGVIMIVRETTQGPQT